jgi:hypothetical protein
VTVIRPPSPGFDRVHVPDALVGDDVTRAVSDDLTQIHDDPALPVPRDGLWLDPRVDHLELAHPVAPDLLAASHPTAVDGVRPVDVRMHPRERSVEIATVERRVAATDEVLSVTMRRHFHLHVWFL